MENIYKKIKDLRKSKVLTQKDMAKALGMTQAGYQKLEWGKTALTIDRIKQIADVFEMNYFELLGVNDANLDSAKLEEEVKKLREEVEFFKKRTRLYKMQLLAFQQLQLELHNDLALLKRVFEQLDDVDISKAYYLALDIQNQAFAENTKGHTGSLKTSLEVSKKENAWKAKLTPQEYFMPRLSAYLKFFDENS